MSDPVAIAYEMLIRDELKRQSEELPNPPFVPYPHETASLDPELVLIDGRVDVAALAKALASPARLVEHLEPGVASRTHDAVQVSQAISLKRIADALGPDASGTPFLQQLFYTLDNASHNHAQRMS